MENDFSEVLSAREEFERVLSALKQGSKFDYRKEYQIAIESYHQAIMHRFRYDILGFVEFFLIKSRKSSDFRKVEWIYSKMLQPLQEILDAMFLGKTLHNYISSFNEEIKKKDEIKEFERRKMFESENLTGYEQVKFFQDFNRERQFLEIELKLINDNRNHSKEVLISLYAENIIEEAIEEYKTSLAFEGESIASSLLKGTDYHEYKTKNPLLLKLLNRRMGFVVKSGNFFGKSFALAVISVWGLLCYDDMVVKSFVSKKDREVNIKRDLQVVGEKILDGTTLDNGIETSIFSHLFILNQRNVYKKVLGDPESTHYWSKWTWFTDFAVGSRDTKGGRSQHQIMIFDEASESPVGAINGAITNLRRELDSMNLIFLTGNPNREVGKPVNEFFKILDLKNVYSKFYNIVELTEKDIDTELVKGSFIVRYLSLTEGKNSSEYKERVGGFVEEDSAIFSRGFVDSCMLKNEEIAYQGLCLPLGEGNISEFIGWATGRFLYVGIDPAGTSNTGDRFGICVRSKDSIAFVCGLYDQASVLNLIRNLWTLKNAKKNIVFCIERNGAGAWFPDYISSVCKIPKQFIKDFVGHGNSHPSITYVEKEACKDLASVCALRLCEALKQGLKIRYNEFLRSELVNIKWKNHSDGKFDIDKETYRTMFKQSPDLFDALCYSFAVGDVEASYKSIKLATNNTYIKRGVC